MNSPDSIEVITRFYKAMNELKAKRKIKSYNAFIRRYDILKTSFYVVKREKESDRFQVAWLAYLIEDYGVSPKWILTGKGKMFTK